jgi:hypothetical protein
MTRSIISSILMLLLTAVHAQEKTVSGVKVPVRVTVETNTLVLNGAGVREKYFMDMYVGALYLKSTTSDAEKICAADEPMLMRLQIVSSLVSSDAMRSAVEEGFKKSTGNNAAPLTREVKTFTEAFADPIKKGDLFELVYSPAGGTSVIKNGTKKTTIPGVLFKKAMLGIWLGKEPAQKDLKEALLGKS